MDINIQDSKIELISWITSINDKSLINKILDLKISNTSDWYENISEDEKASIEKGVNDSNNGNIIPHSEAKKVYEKWL